MSGPTHVSMQSMGLTPTLILGKLEEALERHSAGNPAMARSCDMLIKLVENGEKTLSNRRFDMPSKFYSFDDFIHNIVCVHYWSMLQMVTNQGFDAVAQNTTQGVLVWSGSHGKMIALNADLLADLEATEAPEDTTYGEIEHPYSNYCLALPVGAVKTPDGADVMFVFVCAVKSGEMGIDVSRAPVTEALFRTVVDDAMPEADKDIARQAFVSENTKAAENNCLSVVIWTSNAYYYRIMCPGDSIQLSGLMDDGVAPEGFDHGDDKFIQRIHNIICHLCLYLSSKPDDVIADVYVKDVRRPSFVTLGQLDKSALWRPIEVGTKYAASRRGEERKHGRSPRMHMRKAHWKRQPHGEGRKLRKWIRIELTWVNAPKQEQPNAQ